MERINNRLEGWRARHLTLAGRLILAKSVLSSIPYFAMQTMLFPGGVCDEIDKRIRGFVWGDSAAQRKCHLVNWETVTRSKEEGGLGVRSTREMNKAFLAKLVWRVLTNRNSLWAQVLVGKYMHGKAHTENLNSMPRASNLWRGMVSLKEVVKGGCRHLATTGQDTRFWTDIWICDTPLESLTISSLALGSRTCGMEREDGNGNSSQTIYLGKLWKSWNSAAYLTDRAKMTALGGDSLPQVSFRYLLPIMKLLSATLACRTPTGRRFGRLKHQ